MLLNLPQAYGRIFICKNWDLRINQIIDRVVKMMMIDETMNTSMDESKEEIARNLKLFKTCMHLLMHVQCTNGLARRCKS